MYVCGIRREDLRRTVILIIIRFADLPGARRSLIDQTLVRCPGSMAGAHAGEVAPSFPNSLGHRLAQLEPHLNDLRCGDTLEGIF